MIRQALQFALRDMRGGFKGLRLMVACLVLGVTAITGVGTLSQAIIAGMASKGQALLGGDISVRLTNRPATPSEHAVLQRYGVVSETIRTRAMAVNHTNGARFLAELKAVDKRYPLYGDLTVSYSTPHPGPPPRGERERQSTTLATNDALLDPDLAARLGLHIGDSFTVGEARLTVKALITTEPDRASQGFSLGPSIIISPQALVAAQLIQPGSLAHYHYRIKLGDHQSLLPAVTALKAMAPQAGWQIEDRRNGAPGIKKFVDQLGQFLTFVGLTSLLVSGLGVANAVAAYLDKKVPAIATYKVLGASSSLIFSIYLVEVALITTVSIIIGLALGAALPNLGLLLFQDKLPVPVALGVYAAPLVQASVYGLLIALAATVWPLAKARATPPARLFRAHISGMDRRPPLIFAALIMLALLAVIALASFSATVPTLALGIVVGALMLLILLQGIGFALMWLARHLPKPKAMLPRLALANLYRPGSLAPAVITALGLGLSLLATLAVIETNLNSQIDRVLPDRAPAFFFLDIAKADVPVFTKIVESVPGTAKLRYVPSLRGPITKVNDVPVEKIHLADPSQAWVIEGDRGLTYATEVPEGNDIVAGTWWATDYSGPPLVSVEAEAAHALGLKLGDQITVSVLGVDVTAKVSSFRKLHWDSLGFNFVLVFSPSALSAAPHMFMATVAADGPAEHRLYRQITDQFPAVSAVRIKDVLTSAGAILRQIAVAIRATALFTILAGLFVLIGAMAAGQQARVSDAVMMKVLGATRRQILTIALLEYAALGVVAACVAMAAGTLAGWFVVTHVLNFGWRLSWPPLVVTATGGAALTIIFGLAGTWRALGVRPNQVLRGD